MLGPTLFQVIRLKLRGGARKDNEKVWHGKLGWLAVAGLAPAGALSVYTEVMQYKKLFRNYKFATFQEQKPFFEGISAKHLDWSKAKIVNTYLGLKAKNEKK